ncbi:dephospho-CoA kinase [Rhodanobacter sp. Root480]|uniref:dephospho-CoA kinase n=1 Tax=Rhodanobacter sp. Root480 TaxID=1736542 RepID=UPI0006F601A8|nr:dephospho-CoA kinase [Rhodanobacter sp. Root480]KQX99926.1 dephospho-CoA kinase [Rhodanobacter sp. Root480]
MNARPFVVAVTGGIASGKSAVTRRFQALGVPVHDADVAAREVIEPGTPGLQAVVQAFGPDVLDRDGRLDRPAMRRHVFADDGARRKLEEIIHPRVREWLHDRAMAQHDPYCLLAIPLLVENMNAYRWVNRVLVVDAPQATQIARLVERDGIDAALAQRMLDRQASRAERLAMADDVIDNSGDEAALDDTVMALHRRYLAQAR